MNCVTRKKTIVIFLDATLNIICNHKKKHLNLIHSASHYTNFNYMHAKDKYFICYLFDHRDI